MWALANQPVTHPALNAKSTFMHTTTQDYIKYVFVHTIGAKLCMAKTYRHEFTKQTKNGSMMMMMKIIYFYRIFYNANSSIISYYYVFEWVVHFTTQAFASPSQAKRFLERHAIVSEAYLGLELRH